MVCKMHFWHIRTGLGVNYFEKYLNTNTNTLKIQKYKIQIFIPRMYFKYKYFKKYLNTFKNTSVL